jgi:murein DD-endopeptidase MepM/ murein hydrolase activator NlpD
VWGKFGIAVALCVATTVAPLAAGGAPGRSSDGVGVAGGSGGAPVAAGPAYGTYAWPVDGPVLRPFELPEGPFGPGHRGIDIGVPAGTAVRAAGEGVVAFAGPVAGSLFVSIDHPDGVRTTYSWLSSVRVRAGHRIAEGAVIGASGVGHPGVDPAHLHFGARYSGEYLDPMLLLARSDVVGLIRLAPVEEVGSAT